MDTLTKKQSLKTTSQAPLNNPRCKASPTWRAKEFSYNFPRLTTSLRGYPKNVLQKNFAQGWTLRR